MKQKSTKRNFIVITVLILIFSVYNFFIYTSKGEKNTIILSANAIKGQALWQENNCWSCHQLYGLGGYLGPDLTNTYSNKNKGKEYIKAFLNSGIKSMPKFNFSEKEKEAIVTFLAEVDKTGYYPNKKASFKYDGWVELNYKDE